MRDETLLEVTLAVEEPERARDCANHVSGVPHGLECHDDHAVRVVIGHRQGNRFGETRLPDASRACDGQQPDVVSTQQGLGLGHTLLAADERRQRSHGLTPS